MEYASKELYSAITTMYIMEHLPEKSAVKARISTTAIFREELLTALY